MAGLARLYALGPATALAAARKLLRAVLGASDCEDGSRFLPAGNSQNEAGDNDRGIGSLRLAFPCLGSSGLIVGPTRESQDLLSAGRGRHRANKGWPPSVVYGTTAGLLRPFHAELGSALVATLRYHHSV